jgi:cyanophycin synthetase
LRHPQVSAALLETARGGLLRRGLAMQQAQVAVVTNVSADHLGEYGIDNIDDIAQAKLVVAHAVRTQGTLVLNGADEALLRVAVGLPFVTTAHWAVFARDFDAPILKALRQRGLATSGVRSGRLLLSLKEQEHDLGAVAGMPLSLGGAAPHNVENLAAAALAGGLLGWPPSALRQALHSFGSDPRHNPGRLQRWPWRGAVVLVDYAHNPDGLNQLLSVARALKPRRLGLLLGQAGNRSDRAIAELARVAAGFAPQRVLIKELPLMLRGRAVGEVPALIERGLRQAGLAAEHVMHEPDEEAAARVLLEWAEAGDVIVLPVHTAAARAHLAGVLGA